MTLKSLLLEKQMGLLYSKDNAKAHINKIYRGIDVIGVVCLKRRKYQFPEPQP